MDRTKVEASICEKNPIMNVKQAEKITSQLVEEMGVKTFCLCPGAWNAPFVSVLSQAKGLNVLSFFDERSAAFFAIGHIRKEKRPCAVITTSGTAVAELLPAVIEAHYSHLPLLLITADRPKHYREKGAPQSILQVGIFSHYVEKTWDITQNHFDFSSWSKSLPSHINICFEEPLIDSEPIKKTYQPSAFQFKNLNLFTPEQDHLVKSFFSKVKAPLVILSELPDFVREKVKEVLLQFHLPIYAEPLSGLRESKELDPIILKSGEKYLQYLASNEEIDGVIRVGRCPCTRFWRDLENKYSHLQILSVSDQSYPSVSHAPPAISFEAFFKWAEYSKNQFSHNLKKLLQKDHIQYQKLKALMGKCPRSEANLVKIFSEKIPKESLLFLGNSLPIREWNLCAEYENKNLKYLANRGANGIDGLVSTFLGASEVGRSNWCLLGDLSLLYDLSAPWILNQLIEMKQAGQCFIVAINNGGGKIFSSLFSDPLFLNSHTLTFESLAQLWKLHYYKIHTWPNSFHFLSPALIELTVDHSDTAKFEKEYQLLWNE